MTFSNYLSFLQKILELFPFTVLDLVFFVCLIIFVVSEKQRGLVRAGLTFFFSALTMLFSLASYGMISSFMQQSFTFSKGSADGMSFLLISLLAGVLAVVLYRLILLNISQEYLEIKVTLVAMLFGAGTFLFFTAGMMMNLLSFPVTEFVKQNINGSIVLNKLVVSSQSIESSQKRVIGQPVSALFNFLVPNPRSSEARSIVTQGQLTLSNTEAVDLTNHINQMRTDNNLTKFSPVDDVSKIAASLGQEISASQTFTQVSINGSTPFDVLTKADIIYEDAYFIPIYAQNADLAFNGVMQQGEYSTILSSRDYSRIGVGAVWLKEYGYIFTVLLLN